MGLAPAVKVKADAQPELVRVPSTSFLMIDGHGDPNTSEAYRDAIAALYATSYTLKFAIKREAGLDYKVGPLECLWWAGDMAEFTTGHKAGWSWSAMIAQPEEVTPQRLAAALEELHRKKKDLPGLNKMRLERLEEGLCGQVLHIGPFSAEGPTIERLHAFIRSHGYDFDGRRQKHHEIYTSDPRRSAPAKWRTIIRQPVASERALGPGSNHS
jgi:hypothetical protein